MHVHRDVLYMYRYADSNIACIPVTWTVCSDHCRLDISLQQSGKDSAPRRASHSAGPPCRCATRRAGTWCRCRSPQPAVPLQGRRRWAFDLAALQQPCYKVCTLLYVRVHKMSGLYSLLGRFRSTVNYCTCGTWSTWSCAAGSAVAGQEASGADKEGHHRGVLAVSMLVILICRLSFVNCRL